MNSYIGSDYYMCFVSLEFSFFSRFYQVNSVGGIFNFSLFSKSYNGDDGLMRKWDVTWWYVFRLTF